MTKNLWRIVVCFVVALPLSYSIGWLLFYGAGAYR